jgi:hypothetical protein
MPEAYCPTIKTGRNKIDPASTGRNPFLIHPEKSFRNIRLRNKNMVVETNPSLQLKNLLNGTGCLINRSQLPS